ncbi:MAG: tritrans,polycis-undecaprenyl-diphosphate synthase [Candidatus Methanomethylophilaceae archaeon]|nr:tritrans,polycis-undecaprenyl-diphosphate synthase [Candidatus Methanomethylophilaceae archaeon]
MDLQKSNIQKGISRIISDTAYSAYEVKLEKEVMSAPPPQHVAIIMDGNRRFAKEMGLSRTGGHEKGKDKLEEVMDWCQELGIRIWTVYAFSTENFSRPSEEVESLMDLFEGAFLSLVEDERIHKNRIRVKVLGNLDMLPERVQKAIRSAEEATMEYDSYYYNVALAYGGREELVQAFRRIAAKVEEGCIKADDIDEEMVSQHMYTSHVPDPDLVLRTSGEVRISNFLLWQMAYSELYFTDVYWPGFRRIDFMRAVRTYQQRQRRYGT